MLPAQFINAMQGLLGKEACDEFLDALAQPTPVSIRHNPRKPLFREEAIVDRVPWHPEGQYLKERPVFTLDPGFHAGAYYVQEASSMFLYEALKQTVDFTRPLKILDLCAAPGGKSTLLASMMNDKGLLVANETIRPRIHALRENLEKWGYSNVAITSAEAIDFEAFQGMFDVVVVDAPCSGEGLFRKDPNAVSEWSADQVKVCAVRQKNILASAVKCLAPDGKLVFSTCTYNAAENGDNVAWLSEQFELEVLPLEIPEDWGIEACGGGYQFFPHRLRGEGFYLAVLEKTGDSGIKKQSVSIFRSLTPLAKNLTQEANRWLLQDVEIKLFQTNTGTVLALPADLERDFLILDKLLKIKWFGTPIGTFKGQNFIPDHALALSLIVPKSLPRLELSLEQALRYLKKETFELPKGAGTGWMLVGYNSLNLGWIKALPNRMNNYLPSERRIRMELR